MDVDVISHGRVVPYLKQLDQRMPDLSAEVNTVKLNWAGGTREEVSKIL